MTSLILWRLKTLSFLRLWTSFFRFYVVFIFLVFVYFHVEILYQNLIPGFTANQMSKKKFLKVKSGCPIHLNDLMKEKKKEWKKIYCRVAFWYLSKKDFISYWDTIRKLVMSLVCMEGIIFLHSTKSLFL